MLINALRIKLLTVLFLSLFFTAASYGQEQSTSDPEASDKETTQSESKADAQSDSKDKTDKQLDDETFIPSEEISEDLSVAFPVDI